MRKTKCPTCNLWFEDDGYENHLPCSGGYGPAGASGSESYVDKYAKKGTGRP